MTSDWFADWFDTDYYHLLYRHRDHREAEAFIDSLLSYLAPPPNSRMLDVACGKGRHAGQLSQAGHYVTGIDLSLNSIREARKQESDRLRFYTHDMRQPFHMGHFDYAFNFFTSFGYFRTERENHKALRNIARSLKPGGLFVIDYLNAAWADRGISDERQLTLDGISFHTRKYREGRFFLKQIRVEDPARPGALLFEERVERITAEHLTDLLTRSGLSLLASFGDYQLHPYEPATSPRMILLARRDV